MTGLDKKAVYLALTDDATFATVLHVIALKSYGEEIYQWDILELLLRLEDDYGAKVTEHNESKLNAILMAVSTDLFYDDPEAFRGICETLSNGDPGIELLDNLTLPEVVFGLYEVQLNRPPEEFAPAVQSIIEKVVRAEADDVDETEDPYQGVGGYMAECRERLANQLKDVLGEPVSLPEPASA